ncbi:hypothetical protein AZI86_18445 [Bdellovibrio bacteriovorus]|uniref:OmpR/PhoB-type domain-containing protein n=1 Tax=Bdellovibrio bacteriovorus TaxID=959 RepID=A0A150WFN1_BDEBC|nr:helix-turn-helix domain-containing protein [Bdellovibrio bacteriovorus]KYG61675.1 hypothetical protein AZI86_18445 [Bdellovibrio bacteriovorus]
MKETVTLLLNIARKSYLGADFRQAISYASEAKSSAQGRDWLEAQKYLLGCYGELLEKSAVQSIQDELRDFSRSCDNTLKSCAHYLLAQSFAIQGQWPKVKGNIEIALEAALAQGDFDDISYAIFGAARIDANLGQYQKALEGLSKLESILNARPRPDIQISLEILKSYIYKKLGQFDVAARIAWRAYEFAKVEGFHVHIPIILVSLATLEFDRKNFNEVRVYLSLAEKGVLAEKQPALFNYLQAEKLRLDKVLPVSEFDLIVDTHARVIQEKEKGLIDFRNQHTLLDLALLFLRNPQKSFDKSELLSQVWGRSYAPGSDDNLVYVTIKRLRSMIEPDPENPKYILRTRHGYYFDNRHRLHFKNEEQAAV